DERAVGNRSSAGTVAVRNDHARLSARTFEPERRLSQTTWVSHKPAALVRRTKLPVAAKDTAPCEVPLTTSSRSASVEFLVLYARNSTLEAHSTTRSSVGQSRAARG